MAIRGAADFDAVLDQPTTSHGRWGGAIDTRDTTLATLLPRGFASYARILHPAWRVVPDESRSGVLLGGGIRAVPVAWADVARRQGVEVGRRSRWSDICGPMVGIERSVSDMQGWTYPPDEGVMVERRSLVSLFDLLEEQSGDETGCNCGFWTGYDVRRPMQGMQFRSAYETYWLYRITLGSLARWWTNRDEGLGLTGDTPDMFWPDDEGWFVAVPFDGRATYVGGCQGLIDAIVVARDLEAFQVELSDSRW